MELNNNTMNEINNAINIAAKARNFIDAQQKIINDYYEIKEAKYLPAILIIECTPVLIVVAFIIAFICGFYSLIWIIPGIPLGINVIIFVMKITKLSKLKPSYREATEALKRGNLDTQETIAKFGLVPYQETIDQVRKFCLHGVISNEQFVEKVITLNQKNELIRQSKLQAMKQDEMINQQEEMIMNQMWGNLELNNISRKQSYTNHQLWSLRHRK